MVSNVPRQRDATQRRVEMYRRELSQRAGMFYRLGYPPSRAIKRLIANVTWDFEIGTGGRPPELSDSHITEIVKAAYLRRPSH
jgi:hypothetical protein